MKLFYILNLYISKMYNSGAQKGALCSAPRLALRLRRLAKGYVIVVYIPCHMLRRLRCATLVSLGYGRNVRGQSASIARCNARNPRRAGKRVNKGVYRVALGVLRNVAGNYRGGGAKRLNVRG